MLQKYLDVADEKTINVFYFLIHSLCQIRIAANQTK